MKLKLRIIPLLKIILKDLWADGYREVTTQEICGKLASTPGKWYGLNGRSISPILRIHQGELGLVPLGEGGDHKLRQARPDKFTQEQVRVTAIGGGTYKVYRLSEAYYETKK